MTFLPGKIRTSLPETACCSQMDNTFNGECKGRKVDCGKCGKLAALGSLAPHQATTHNIYQSLVLKGEEEGAPPLPKHWYAAFFPKECCYRCPIPDYPQGWEGHRARDCWNLPWHFTCCYQQDRVAIGDAYFQKYRLCGMQVSPVSTLVHETSRTCRQMVAARCQHAVTAQGKTLMCHTLMTYGEPLKRVKQFKYFGAYCLV